MQYILSEDEMMAFKNLESKEMTLIRVKEAEQVFKIFVEEVGCWQIRGTCGYCDDCPLLDLGTICTRYRECSQ